MNNFILDTDGYKLDHRRQYPVGTEYVYSNFTARNSRLEGINFVVFFGLQSVLMRFFGVCAYQTFFNKPKKEILYDYGRFLDSYLGEQHGIPLDHIEALHDLQYIPLEFRALPEGVNVPIKVPMFTVENTHPDFFWLTNYFETALSKKLWQPIRNATIAREYRKIFEKYAKLTGGSLDFVDFQGHDFSMRGMAGDELANAGHLLFFKGTDTIPAILRLQEDYEGVGLIGCSVPATEHSVMCAGGQEDELDTLNRLLDLYPSGILSVVSDTWDLWKLIIEYLPKLKDKIMARDGKLVIRPDSGDPVKILTGDPSGNRWYERTGVIPLLAGIFGSIENSKGYFELDSHIGAIYGDSITRERSEEICQRLMNKGFASTNWVAGIGSYTYQYGTRDDFGMAMKATWARVGGQERMLSKDPITDSGIKKSARGRLVVVKEEGKLKLIDNLTYDQWMEYRTERAPDTDLLNAVWRDGRFIKKYNLEELCRNLVV